MSQLSQLRAHLDAGKTITPMEALRKWGCLRLAARVWDLRLYGYPVSSRTVYRGEKRWKEYWRPRRG